MEYWRLETSGCRTLDQPGRRAFCSCSIHHSKLGRIHRALSFVYDKTAWYRIVKSGRYRTVATKRMCRQCALVSGCGSVTFRSMSMRPQVQGTIKGHCCHFTLLSISRPGPRKIESFAGSKGSLEGEWISDDERPLFRHSTPGTSPGIQRSVCRSRLQRNLATVPVASRQIGDQARQGQRWLCG